MQSTIGNLRVWSFRVGGCRVCEKWLKDRKGRTLDCADLQHYRKIVVALSATIRLMAAIDQAIEMHAAGRELLRACGKRFCNENNDLRIQLWDTLACGNGDRHSEDGGVPMTGDSCQIMSFKWGSWGTVAVLVLAVHPWFCVPLV